MDNYNDILNQIYEKQTNLDGTIVFTKIIVNCDKYNISKDSNGNILLKPKKIKELTNKNEILQNDFTHSKIIKCIIDDKNVQLNKYFNIIQYIYNKINDGATIIKNSLLNVKTTNENDHGFRYLKKIGISVQGAASNKNVQEIIEQCKNNSILIDLMIQLKNSDIIRIKI